MSRFLVAIFVGAATTAAGFQLSVGISLLASSPNGATGKAFGIILERAQSISLRRCIHHGGGTGCKNRMVSTVLRFPPCNRGLATPGGDRWVAKSAFLGASFVDLRI